MNKKGILLVELLSVTIVVVLIFIICVSSYLVIIKESKENIKTNQDNIFITATKLYLASTQDYNKVKEVSINDLIQANYLEDTIFIDPNSNKVINNNSTILINHETGEYRFVPYYSTEGLLINIDGYKLNNSVCNSIICLTGNYDNKLNYYSLSNILIDINKYENYTISMFMNVENDTSNNYFTHNKGMLTIHKEVIPISTLGEFTTYDIVKKDNTLIIYIDSNKVYEGVIYNYIPSINIINDIKLYNIRFYNKALVREEIITNTSINEMRFINEKKHIIIK